MKAGVFVQALCQIILNFVGWIKPLGPALLVAIIVISGVACGLGSMGRRFAIGLIAGGLIGTLLILGGETIANEILKNLVF